MQRHSIFHSLISCLLVSVCVVAIATEARLRLHTPAPVGVINHRNLVALPPELVPAVAQTLASRSPDTWYARDTGKTVLFSNPAQRLTMRFDRHGATLELDDKQFTHVTLNMTGYRSEHSTHPVLAGAPAVHGNRVEFARGSGITEWYVNSPLGVEQGFKLTARPPSTATDPVLMLAFSLHGNLEPLLKDNALEFSNSHGKTVLRYGDLIAWDARQQKLPAHMQLENHRLLLSVDTTGAVFPVTLDPLFSVVTTFTAAPAATSNDGFGISIALSGDGNTALIGALGTMVSGQANAGVAYVYGRSNGFWSTTPLQTFTDPTATAGDDFGVGVALSGDGNTALIGAYGVTVSGQGLAGAAYVYGRSNGAWSATPLQTFTDPPATVGNYFGSSVALSGDGNAALIGALGTSVSGQVDAGAAYVYGRSNGVWSTTPLQTFTDPLATAGDYFSINIALSGDGNTALIGAWGAMAYAGAAYVYGRSNGVWSATPLQTFTDPLATVDDFFGYSVALSNDGSIALIGAFDTVISGQSGGDQAGAGAAYVYGQSNGVWSATPLQTFTDPAAMSGDEFGVSVALSGDGNTTLIGAWGAVGFSGAAYVYGRSNGVWSNTPLQTFTDPLATAGDEFGSRVALSGDANTALIGALNTTVSGQASAGAAYAFSSTADLSLALSSNPGSVTVGQAVSYMLTATNNDTQVTAISLTLTDILPAGMTFVSAAAAGGSCNNSNGTVTCTLASLAPQATWQPTITVMATTVGSINDSASVNGSQPDPNSANNNATVTTMVVVAPPVASNGSVTTPENTPATGTLSASDPQNLSLTFSIVNQPSHGSVTLTNTTTGAFTYSPANGFNGMDSFTFKANNGTADSNTATESITVNASGGGGGSSGGNGSGGSAYDGLMLMLLLGTLLWRRHITRLVVH